MAIALTPFTAMCGFRNPSEILKFAEALPELSKVLGSSALNTLKSEAQDEEKIEACYNAIFKSKKDFKTNQIDLLAALRADETKYANNLGDVFELIHSAFPGRLSLKYRPAPNRSLN